MIWINFEDRGRAIGILQAGSKIVSVPRAKSTDCHGWKNLSLFIANVAKQHIIISFEKRSIEPYSRRLYFKSAGSEVAPGVHVCSYENLTWQVSCCTLQPSSFPPPPRGIPLNVKNSVPSDCLISNLVVFNLSFYLFPVWWACILCVWFFQLSIFYLFRKKEK